MLRLQLILSTALILIGHIVGSFFDVYQKLFWYDMPMHFLGGFWITSVIIYFLTIHPRHTLFHETPWKNIIISFGGAMIISISWEFFEMFLSYFQNNLSCYFIGPKNRYVDTMLDLGFDMLGALFASLVLLKRNK